MLVSSRKRLLFLLATFAISTFTSAQDIFVPIRAESDDADEVTATVTPTGDDRVTVEMASTRQGYLAFGFSLDRFMADSLIVVGLPDDNTVLKYDAPSQTTPTVSASQTLEDESIVYNGTHTVMKFTKLIEEEGEPTVNLEGANIFLWALGASNALAYHGAFDRGDFDVDFSVGEAVVSESTNYRGLWMTHGILMGLAWAILIPIGVGVSVFRSFIPGDGTWFKLHRALNGTGLIMMVIGFFIAVYIIGSSGANHFNTDIPHHITGLIISLFGFIQGLWGAFRPHGPHAPPPKADGEEESHQPEPKSQARVIFEYGHRILGVALLATAWYNTSIGLDIFSARFETTDLSLAMWIVVALITAVTVGLGVKQRL